MRMSCRNWICYFIFAVLICSIITPTFKVMPDFININHTLYPKNLSKDELAKLPIDYYHGKIVLIDEEEISPDVIKEIFHSDIVGFDCEAKPTFKKGESSFISLIQLAIKDKVFLIRLLNQVIPSEIIYLFESKKIVKCGIGLQNDIFNLRKMVNFSPKNVVDLNDLAKSYGFEGIGAKKLSAILLGFSLNKRMQTSNWEINELSKEQIIYAATDAWICYEIFRKFQSFSK